MRTGKRAGATSIGKRTALAILRVSETWNGMSCADPLATSMRRNFPPAQTTIARSSGVHAMPG